MWRRSGDTGYAALVLGIFTVEAFGLAALTWAFFLRRSGIGPSIFGLKQALVGGVAITALALMVLTVYTLGYQVISARRERHYNEEMLAWSDRWIDVVFGDKLPPPGPLSQAGSDALLDLRESVRGEAALTVRELISAYGIDSDLIDRVNVGIAHTFSISPASSRSPSGKTMSPNNFAKRLDALDALARARSPEAVPTLMVAARDTDPASRLVAVRALTRSASAIDAVPGRDVAAAEIVELLHSAQLSGGAVEEALQLLDSAAPHAVGIILEEHQRFGPRFVCAALDTIGRLGLTEFVHVVVTFADHRRVAVRAAAIRALGDIGQVPTRTQPVIRRALHDRNEIVRVEASRVARLLDPRIAVRILKPMLDDPAWTVRRAAAASLAAMGELGRTALIETALEHPEPNARNIAGQVLVESRALFEVPVEQAS